MYEVELTAAEIYLGALAGVLRQVENITRGRRNAHGLKEGEDWQRHIEGCLGEQALSKYLGVYWSGKGIFRGPDVAGRHQVRTASQHHYCLILHEEDQDDDQFWLVTGSNGSYVVRGWIMAAQGKQEMFWEDPTGSGRPAYFVPQHFLYSPSCSSTSAQSS